MFQQLTYVTGGHEIINSFSQWYNPEALVSTFYKQTKEPRITGTHQHEHQETRDIHSYIPVQQLRRWIQSQEAYLE